MAPLQQLPPGWTAWVSDLDLTSTMHGKVRPFCRGQASALGGPWFPRTSKRPFEGDRWAVYSPPNHLPTLEQEGWFVASCYVFRPDHFTPRQARPCGVISPEIVTALHQKLKRFFLDQFARR